MINDDGLFKNKCAILINMLYLYFHIKINISFILYDSSEVLYDSSEDDQDESKPVTPEILSPRK